MGWVGGDICKSLDNNNNNKRSKGVLAIWERKEFAMFQRVGMENLTQKVMFKQTCRK